MDVSRAPESSQGSGFPMSQVPGPTVDLPMKRFALTLTLGLAAWVANPAIAQPSGDDGVWMADFDAAVAVAKKDGKNLLVDFTGSDWCGWCKRLHKEVFAHEIWETTATKEYVLVALDFPRDEAIKKLVPNPERNAELSEKYGIEGFPTILLMTPDGDVFGRTGYQEGGPEKYLEHMAELKKTGMLQLEAVHKVVAAYNAATGDEQMAIWERVAALLEKNGADSAGAGQLVEIVEKGIALDPDNAKGILAKALTTLLGAGKYSDEYFAKAKGIDAKNETGLYETAVAARLDNVNSEEAMLSSLVEVDAFSKLGKVVDKTRCVRIYSIGAFFAMRFKQDEELAKTYAQKSADLGGLESEEFGELIKGILNPDAEEDEDGEIEEGR